MWHPDLNDGLPFFINHVDDVTISYDPENIISASRVQHYVPWFQETVEFSAGMVSDPKPGAQEGGSSSSSDKPAAIPPKPIAQEGGSSGSADTPVAKPGATDSGPAPTADTPEADGTMQGLSQRQRDLEH